MTYKEMYYRLFNAITDAIQDLQARNYGQALDLLKQAQADTEAMYMENGAAEDEWEASAMG